MDRLLVPVLVLLLLTTMPARGSASDTEGPNDSLSKLAVQLRRNYPTSICVNVERVRQSYLGQIYLTNLFDNLGKSDPAVRAFGDMFFQDLDFVYMFAEMYVSKPGQSTQSIPPFIAVVRGRVDRAKWKTMLLTDTPAIKSETIELYRTSFQGDVQLDNNPVFPAVLKDRDLFVGFLRADTAIISVGVPESNLRELFHSLKEKTDPDAYAEFAAFKEQTRNRMIYGDASPASKSDEESAPKSITLSVDLVDQIQFDFQFDLSSVRSAAQMEASAHKYVEQVKALVAPFLRAVGKQGEIVDELVRAARVERKSQKVLVSLHAPMALLHMWASPGRGFDRAYMDSDGSRLDTAENSQYIILTSVTEARAADEFLPSMPGEGAGEYYRRREECYGIDGSRQCVPGTRFSIVIDTYRAADPALKLVSTEYFGPNRMMACSNDGYSKKTRIYASTSSMQPIDATFLGTEGEPLSVYVGVDRVLPESQASKIGLTKGDQIISIGGVKATSIERVKSLLLDSNVVDAQSVDHEVMLVVRRAQNEMDFRIKRSQLGVALRESAIMPE